MQSQVVVGKGAAWFEIIRHGLELLLRYINQFSLSRWAMHAHADVLFNKLHPGVKGPQTTGNKKITGGLRFCATIGTRVGTNPCALSAWGPTVWGATGSPYRFGIPRSTYQLSVGLQTGGATVRGLQSGGYSLGGYSLTLPILDRALLQSGGATIWGGYSLGLQLHSRATDFGSRAHLTCFLWGYNLGGLQSGVRHSGATDFGSRAPLTSSLWGYTVQSGWATV